MRSAAFLCGIVKYAPELKPFIYWRKFKACLDGGRRLRPFVGPPFLFVMRRASSYEKGRAEGAVSASFKALKKVIKCHNNSGRDTLLAMDRRKTPTK